jgi:translation initiation factor IF-3
MKQHIFHARTGFLTRFVLFGGEIITKKPINEDLVNESIRFKELLVIGPNGEQLGVMFRREALAKAEELELDLFCVAPNAQPPVCKILDYGKHRFESQKKAREAKKNQHVTEVKPLRLSPVIDTHDFETKLKHARKWILEGMKVKVDMRFRGRLITRLDVGKKVMNDFMGSVSDIANVEKYPTLEGNMMHCILAPKKK